MQNPIGYMPVLYASQLLISGIAAIVPVLIKSYGYVAIFALMVLESATIPVPSEVILPLGGYLAAKGVLNLPLVFISGAMGSMVGMVIDYTIGYYIGKDFVYKHLRMLHIKKSTLDGFDGWFNRNAVAAVMLSRMLPVVRTIMSFPAGFARMDIKEFLLYSLIGIVVWDGVLTMYGYYFLSAKSAITVLVATGVFAIALYALYIFAKRRFKI